MKTIEEIIEEFREKSGLNKFLYHTFLDKNEDNKVTIDLFEIENFLRQAYQAGIEAALAVKPKKHNDDMDNADYFNMGATTYEDNIRKLIKE